MSGLCLGLSSYHHKTEPFMAKVSKHVHANHNKGEVYIRTHVNSFATSTHLFMANHSGL